MRMGVQAHPPAATAPRQGPTELSDPPCRLLSMDWKIELVAIPVTDVDRAKEFYVERAGFHADHDYQVTETLRFVQLTPPGSACSIVLGTGITEMPPGSQGACNASLPTSRPRGENSSSTACRPATLTLSLAARSSPSATRLLHPGASAIAAPTVEAIGGPDTGQL